MGARVWFWVHSLIGVTAGLLIFVIAWAGASAVFSREIDWALTPAIRAEGPANVVSYSRIEAAVRAAYPDSTIETISAPWSPGFAADVLVDTPTQDAVHVYVNPATARVQGATSFFNVQRFFRSFHMELFWGVERWGYYVVGLMALALLASATTALLFYKRWWRGLFNLDTRRGFANTLSDAHKLLGAWSLLFIFIMGLTGAWYLVKRMDGVFLTLPRPEQVETQTGGKPLTKPGAEAPLSLDQLVARVHARRPDLEIRTIFLPAKPLQPVRFDGFAGEFLASEGSNQITLDPADGAILNVTHAHELSPYFRWVASVDQLHTGRWGGLATRMLWFCFGVAVASMSLTGAYLQVRRQARHNRRLPRVAVAIPYACVIAILALSVRGAIEQIHAFGPYTRDAQAFPDVALSVRCFIGAWLLTLITPLLLWARWVR